jgi:hypothetical protein
MGDDLIWISGAHDLVLAWACSAAALLLSSLYDFTWSYPPLALVGVIALAHLRTDCASAPHRPSPPVEARKDPLTVHNRTP